MIHRDIPIQIASVQQGNKKTPPLTHGETAGPEQRRGRFAIRIMNKAMRFDCDFNNRDDVPDIRIFSDYSQYSPSTLIITDLTDFV